ncbi:MAG: ATP-dependent nuclease [Aureispira sp.]
MYLKKLTIQNFRKFREQDNTIEFVDAKSYKDHNSGEQINIAPVTTLIIGKNNSGKTTIATALEKLIDGNKFKANDFNFSYLKEKLRGYQQQASNPDVSVTPPFLEFKLTIGIEADSKDLVTNIVPFMTIGDVHDSELEILIRYEPAEVQKFHKSVSELLNEGCVDFRLRFNKFLNIIEDPSSFKTKYYNKSEEEVAFKIKDLIELMPIRANNIDNEQCLSKAFSKIVEYRYQSLISKGHRQELEANIEEINAQLTQNITQQHTTTINDSLQRIESSQKLEMLLSSDLTFKKLMSSIMKYEYIEKGHNIPENQFGLGYTNLMMIIADLIDYMEKYPDESFNSKVNLISIEEPETFMHPQMQELFIKHINEAIASLLANNNKKVNSQLIITTHSSHILNSKIHSGKTFNNINYITTLDNRSHAVPLNDEKITPSLDKDKALQNLNFLKKHIKYKVSELFFSDAVIFVEGITEETLIRYYLENNSNLNKHYISIFNIDGAHAHVYNDLIKLLKVPTLIITDLDIKRSEEEKKGFTQITSLEEKITTNNTIKLYNIQDDKPDNKLSSLPEKIEEDNLRISYQGKIENYYATSFEEAFILTNYKNSILIKVLKSLRPNITKKIIGSDNDYELIKASSYKLQQKLSNSKSDFSNKLLYEFIISEEFNASDETLIPSLPTYIKDSLTWLFKKLNPTAS